MIWDNLSFFIVVNILESAKKKEEITTWEIAKRYILEQEGKEGDNDSIQRVDSSIKGRLKDMAEENLVKIVKKCQRCEHEYEIETKIKVKPEEKPKMCPSCKQIEWFKNAYLIIEKKLFLKKQKFPDRKIKQALIVKEDKYCIYEI